MILKRQASCPVMLGSVGQLSSRKEKEKRKTSAYPLKLDGKKKRKRRKTLKRQESCPTILSSGGSSYISSASAVSRMGALSITNRREMKSILHAIRRDREEYTRERCNKKIEETLHRLEEQSKALLVKWQTMSEQRKSHG